MWIDGKLCRLCLVTSRLSDIYRLNLDRSASRMLWELSKLLDEESRTEAFTKSFKLLEILSRSRDPYRGYKRILDDIGRRVAETIRSYIESTGWDLKEMFRLAAAANVVDLSILGYTPRSLEEAIWDKPAIEEYPEIPVGESVYIALDNMGEARVDMVLAEALRVNGYDVKLLVRSESYEIDVMRSDLEDMGLNFEVIETPGNKPPIVYAKGGFTIAKGIANLEAYLELEEPSTRTLHLLRAKCDVLARAFNVPKNSPIIVTGETARAIIRSSKVRLGGESPLYRVLWGSTLRV